MNQLYDLLAEIESFLTRGMRLVDWAEDEIAQAQARHRDKAGLLYHALALLQPTADLMAVEFVYRGHCRELLERVAAGGDTREATAAEVAIACSHASRALHLGTAAVTVYMRTWARAFPDTPAFEVLDLASYEHVAGTAADQLETEVRRRLRQPGRALAAIDCPGRHHGQPRPDCPYTTARTEPEGTP